MLEHSLGHMNLQSAVSSDGALRSTGGVKTSCSRAVRPRGNVLWARIGVWSLIGMPKACVPSQSGDVCMYHARISLEQLLGSLNRGGRTLGLCPLLSCGTWYGCFCGENDVIVVVQRAVVYWRRVFVWCYFSETWVQGTYCCCAAHLGSSSS